MNEFLLNAFLVRYCYLSAVIPNDCRQDPFGELADVFCLEYEKELSDYRWLLCAPHFASMQDKNSFERFCRILEFGRLSGQNATLSDAENRVLSAKREALGALHKILPAGELARESVSSALYAAAVKGDLYAMTALAYMEYHGIGMRADREGALRRIFAAARWNDLFANLMGLAYDTKRQSVYNDRLHTVRFGAGIEICDSVTAFREITAPARHDAVAALLERAFAMQIVKPECYDRTFGRVVFSSLASVQDKEKLLFAGREAIASLARLPFDVKNTPMSFDFSLSAQVPWQGDRILRNLTVLLTGSHLAKPLFLSCADNYAAWAYADLFRRGFADSPLYTVDAKSLTERDFSRSEEHLLLRAMSCTRSACPVILVTGAEELSPHLSPELVGLFDPRARERFALSYGVSMDLSGARFIFIAACRTAALRPLYEECDTVNVAALTKEEKSFILQRVFDTRKACFGCDRMQLEDACVEPLAGLDLEKAEAVLDCAIGMALYQNRDAVTLLMVKQIMEEKRITAQKRGFGYSGGNYGTN